MDTSAIDAFAVSFNSKRRKSIPRRGRKAKFRYRLRPREKNRPKMYTVGIISSGTITQQLINKAVKKLEITDDAIIMQMPSNNLANLVNKSFARAAAEARGAAK